MCQINKLHLPNQKNQEKMKNQEYPCEKKRENFTWENIELLNKWGEEEENG